MVPPNQPFQRGFATYKTSSYWVTPMFLRPILDRSSLPSLDVVYSSQVNWYVIVSVCQHIFLKFVRLRFSKKYLEKVSASYFFLPSCWGPPLLPWVSVCIHVGSVQCAKPVWIQCAELAARGWYFPFFCCSYHDSMYEIFPARRSTRWWPTWKMLLATGFAWHAGESEHMKMLQSTWHDMAWHDNSFS